MGNCTHRNDGRTVIFVKANDMEQEKKLAIPEGWGFDRVENGEVILKKVVEELPKTWADCINKPGGGNRLGVGKESSPSAPPMVDTAERFIKVVQQDAVE